MPTSAPLHRRLRLANGLAVALLHEPELPQAAALVRIGAGSHQAPRAFPGLAHFLEHLFFLGSRHYPAADGLMPLVQRLGGELNASTRETTTDFFFALPPEHLGAGLSRLLDMLAAPLLAPEAQRREREVLHAEFIAWSRSADTRRDLALAAGLPAAHLAVGFHAGNRYSLPLQSPAFQAALHHFQRQHYRAANALLVLAGPQSLAALADLAQAHGALLPSGPAPRAVRPQSLPATGEHWQTTAATPPTLALQFALDDLPPGSWEAAELLETLLLGEHPGGLPAALRQAGQAERLSLAWPYRQARQGLLRLDLAPGPQASPGRLTSTLFAWLDALCKTPLAALQQGHAERVQRQWATLPALALVRRLGERLWLDRAGNASPHPALSAAAQAAWPLLLAQLVPERLTGFATGLADRPSTMVPATVTFALPAPNPLLAAPITPSAPAKRPWPISPALAPQRREGLLFLRWQWPGQAPVAPEASVLGNLPRLATEAGVNLRWSPPDAPWELRLQGWADALPATLEQALERLVGELATSRPVPAAPTEPMLIRQLLKVLPERLSVVTPPRDADHSGPGWQALACGLPSAAQTLLAAVAPPPQPFAAVIGDPPLFTGRHWHPEPSPDAQQALLLFCPQPDAQPATEAAWRLLAARLQAPLFRRLRSERQLGYAVFSAYRQLGDQGGLLIGVQSPHARAAELLAEIEGCLADSLATVQAEPATLAQSIRQLVRDFSPATPQRAALAERLWWGFQRNGALDLEPLREALAALDERVLLQAWSQLTAVDAPRFALANAAAPSDWMS
ncbi:pyrroloquinoline quinone biosynthesis protein PqqF [Pseudomonas sp. EpS/L25]|uniref:pyrroloquinoline quinone biosynthesis protein PqqF n=1 Tax=Pseudomonas sp. EpS/L25 TaxID=1749078 RepID=UPI0007441AB6|nr:pyrroloquinoline quinone biosynthesis protein PqqF [Pseudomonas sp. EpS/L25]KUM38648.1 pyrroloquinoline quinone biosynthesis protein PqqF [Pseudomonas sp. EpS/L25]